MMNSKVRLVIFDLDGTLVDAYKAVASSINYMLSEMRLPAASDHAITKAVGWGVRPLVVTFVGEENADKGLSIYRLHHARALKSGTKFLPGAKELLLDLKKQGYKLAIATNRAARFTHIILKHLGVQPVFDYVLCGDEIDHPKPAPDMLQKILAKFSLKPEQVLYVGDMTVDVECGHAAGVKTAAVITGSSDRKEIAHLKPLRIMAHISEVGDILAEAGFSGELYGNDICC